MLSQKVAKLRRVYTYTPRFWDAPHETGLDVDRVKQLADIPGHIVLLVCLHEDDRFFMHKGFNIPEIKRSFFSSIKQRRLKGGSSITQQLAKNVFMLPTFRIARKPIEALYAVLLERAFTKDEIFILYLDNIRLTWKGGMGIHEAVKLYFRKTPHELTIGETLFLCNLIPQPSFRSYWVIDAGMTDYFNYTHLYGRLLDFIRLTVNSRGPNILNQLQTLSFRDAQQILSEYSHFQPAAFESERQRLFVIRAALEMNELREVLKNLVDPKGENVIPNPLNQGQHE